MGINGDGEVDLKPAGPDHWKMRLGTTLNVFSVIESLLHTGELLVIDGDVGGMLMVTTTESVSPVHPAIDEVT
jgi:hypothetical protein